MHKVLVNRLGGLSLPRKSVVRLTDHPDMTLDVYRGRKTTMQQQQPFTNGGKHVDMSLHLFCNVYFLDIKWCSILVFHTNILQFGNLLAYMLLYMIDGLMAYCNKLRKK